jgi:hypothetical protein
MCALAVAAHVACDAWLGWALLSLRARRPSLDDVPAAFLLGMYAETLCTGTLLFLDLSLPVAALATLTAVMLVSVVSWWRGVLCTPTFAWVRPRWFEVLVLLTVAEKIAFACWQLWGMPLYFDDAVTHWAGRARALYGGVNWSLDPHSPLWLGPDPHARHYPLLTVVWRAETALLCGGWDDLLARADGLVFFLAAIASVWLAVLRFSQARWLAALAAFVVAAIPLQAWHAAAGYSDIAVEAFAVAALAALLREDWLLAGVLAAGTGWAKNDGLVLFMPALLLCATLMRKSFRDVLWFGAGCATLAPWLLIKAWLALGIAPNRDAFRWQRDALSLFVQFVLFGPTSSILWLGIGAALLLSGRTLWRERLGRALLCMLLAQFALLFVIYGCTDSHFWLETQGTIHRSMLQLSASAVIVAAYSIWLNITWRRS